MVVDNVKTRKMKEKEYYKLMNRMDSKTDFKTIHKNWFKCFDYILRSFREGHNERTIKSLFYNFQMDNWTAMHIENTEYKNHTKAQLINSFCGECCYISDRASYDRLFRTHWLFRRAFYKELYEIKP